MSDEYRYAWLETGQCDQVRAFYDNVWSTLQYKKNPAWLEWQFLNNPNTGDQPPPLLLAHRQRTGRLRLRRISAMPYGVR